MEDGFPAPKCWKCGSVGERAPRPQHKPSAGAAQHDSRRMGALPTSPTRLNEKHDTGRTSGPRSGDGLPDKTVKTMTHQEFRSLLERLGISQLEAARRLARDPSTVRRWVKRGTEIPKVPQVVIEKVMEWRS